MPHQASCPSSQRCGKARQFAAALLGGEALCDRSREQFKRGCFRLLSRFFAKSKMKRSVVFAMGGTFTNTLRVTLDSFEALGCFSRVYVESEP